MKFNCDVFKQRRVARRIAEEEWWAWFAWFPVRVAPGDCRWLELVQRRRQWHRYYIADWFLAPAPDWEYRAL